jgi:hypothetical protein
MEQEIKQRQEQMNMARQALDLQRWQAEEDARYRAWKGTQDADIAQQQADAPFDMWRAEQQHQQERGRQFAEAMTFGDSTGQGFQAPMLGQAMGIDAMMQGARTAGEGWAEIAAASMGGGPGGVQEQAAADTGQMNKLNWLAQNPQIAKLLGKTGKTGGTVPEDGVYELHKGEQVIPTPETYKDVLMNVLTGRPLKKDTSGRKPKDSFQFGAPDIREDLDKYMAMSGRFPGSVRGQMAEDVGGAMEEFVWPWEAMDEEEGAAPEEFEPEVQDDIPVEGVDFGEDPYGEGGPPMPESYKGSKSAAQGAPEYRVDESPISEKGKQMRPEQETVKKYTMSGDPMSPEEQFEQEGQRRQREIDSYNERAQGLMDTAANLKMYAMERPNSPASFNLMEMAKEKEQQAKEMLAVGQMKQQRKDEWEGMAAEQIARVTAAEIEKETEAIRSRGRVAGEQIKAQGGLAEKEMEQQWETMFKAIEALRNLGMEEEAAALLQPFLASFSQQRTDMGG